MAKQEPTPKGRMKGVDSGSSSHPVKMNNALVRDSAARARDARESASRQASQRGREAEASRGFGKKFINGGK